jgi:hypothetical protein
MPLFRIYAFKSSHYSAKARIWQLGNAFRAEVTPLVFETFLEALFEPFFEHKL